MPKTYTFYIDGMTCISCSSIIETYLKDRLSNKLHYFRADVTTTDPKKTTIILLDDDRDHREIWLELKQYIEDLGFSCRDYEYQPAKDQPPIPDQPTNTLKKIIARSKLLLTSHWFLGILGCISGIAVLIICLATGGLPLTFMIPLAICSTLLTLALGANSYYEAWSKLTKTGTLTMDSLFAISTLSILVVSIASLFVPWLPMMFEAGLLIYGFRHIGIAIEDTIKEKIGTAKFQDRTPQTVRKQVGDSIEEIPIDQIKPEDIIVVHPGEIIPLDGICDNESIIYNTIITGATLPRYFPPKEKVLAGMRLADNANPLKIYITRNRKDSYLARLDMAIEKSALEKAPIEIKTSELLTYFIPTVLVLAILSGVIIGLFFPPAIAIQCAVSVLVSACPCTLGLITPLAVKTGMHKAAENGVQFKSAKTLQQAEQIDTVIFDLNGTLTTGVPLVKQLYLFDESLLSEADLLSLCATLEKKSSHPIGKAIYSFAKQNSIENQEVSQLDDSHHAGITGQIKDKNYAIGSMTLMKEKGITIPQRFRQPALAAGDQIVYIAREHTVVGFMIVTDPLRDDAYCTIKTLKARGKKVILCTGADEETAFRYAQALGIEKIYANCVATSIDEKHKSKTSIISTLRKQGYKVAMIGDAGNDTHAITASDLGIAVASHGSDDLTLQAADIVIHTGSLLPIASAFAISQHTVSNINQNLAMSLIYNLGSIFVAGGLLVALGVTLNPVVGVVLMILQACFILMNVYRFKQQPLEHLQEEEKQYQKACKPKEETSHIKINRHTFMNKNEPVIEDSPPFHGNKTRSNKRDHCFFGDDCFSKSANTSPGKTIEISETNSQLIKML